MKVDLTVNGERLKLVNDVGTTHINCDLVEDASKVEIGAGYEGEVSPIVEVRIEDAETGVVRSYGDAFSADEDLNEIRGKVTWNDFVAHFDDEGPWVEFNDEMLPKLYRFNLILFMEEVPRVDLKLFGIGEVEDE